MVQSAKITEPTKLSTRLMVALVATILSNTFLLGAIESKRKLMLHFDKIEVKGALQVFIEPGNRNREIEYFASSEIIDSIEARVLGRTLYLEANNSFDLSRRIPLIRVSAQRIFPVEIMVKIDSLKEVRLHDQSNVVVKGVKSDKMLLFSNSSGTLLVDSLKCPALELRQEGSGSVILRGRETHFLKATVFNEGELRGEELFLDRAEVTHHGTGNLFLAPDKWLDLKLNGTGNLTLLEKPDGRVVKKSKGSGSVIEAYK
ncbi:MAG: DUF2807 domain-containing protein [Opitutales bacterium]|nr:DUF2807 domain-containing protein [Opitutales bacterium]